MSQKLPRNLQKCANYKCSLMVVMFTLALVACFPCLSKWSHMFCHPSCLTILLLCSENHSVWSIKMNPRHNIAWLSSKSADFTFDVGSLVRLSESDLHLLSTLYFSTTRISDRYAALILGPKGGWLTSLICVPLYQTIFCFYL